MCEPVPLYVVNRSEAAPVSLPFYLTAKEMEVLRLVCMALSDKAIAVRLAISPKTVSTHLGMIYTKLGVSAGHDNARIAAVLKAMHAGLFPEDVADAMD